MAHGEENVILDVQPQARWSAAKLTKAPQQWKGKANPEENAFLRPGDTVVVHGNLFKTITKISSMVGVTSLVTFMTNGAR